MSVEDEQPEPPRRATPAVWPVPPEGGWTVDDLYRLPDLPSHTELIDGSLVFVSPQSVFHEMAVDLVKSRLTALTPEQYRVFREMSVVLDAQNVPEPDVLVVRSEGLTGLDQTRFAPADVVLAVEVVSPDSRSRDRETKPVKYAHAGIPHFWRVERSEEQAVVYVFELEPTSRVYTPTGIFHERLKTSVPFAVDIDLTRISLPGHGG